MNSEVRGWRTTPPALVIALVAWIGFMAFRCVYLVSQSEEFPWSERLGLASEGVTMVGFSLALLGTLELSRRSAGRLAMAAKIAAAGFALGLGLELFSSLMNFDPHVWEKKWVREIMPYGYWASWVTVGAAFSWAAWAEHRALAIAGLVIVVVCDPPPMFAEPIFKSLDLGFKSYFALDSILRVLRTSMLLVLALTVSRGETPTDRPAGAEGLRLAARGMWLKVIVACALVLLTLMAMGSRSGGEGMYKMIRFVTMAGACVTTLAFAMFGVGIARTARASILDLPRYPLALSAACSLWCCGIELSKLPFVYRMLYKSNDYGGYGDRDYMTTFSLAEPLVAIAAVALLAVAVGNFASGRRTIALQSEAQGKGIGIVFMMLASLGIQNWLLPKAIAEGRGSLSTAMVLMLLAAGAGFVAVVMIAKLCASAAEEIEREPGLPTASVIPPG